MTVKAQLHRIIGFSLGVALLAGAASAAEVSAPDAASTLTFVEVRSDAVIQPLEAIDFSPGCLPRPEVCRQSL